MSTFPLKEGPQAFLRTHEQILRPLRIRHGKAYWTMATTGSSEATAEVERIEREISDLHADPAVYDALMRWDSGGALDPLVARQIRVLRTEFREAQVPAELRAELIRGALSIEERFSSHRAEIDGAPVHNNEIDRILVQEDDVRRRRAAWEASRAIGAIVRDDVRALAKLRNEQARTLGARDYFAFALEQQSIDEGTLLGVLDQVHKGTDGAWSRIRTTLVDEACSRFRCREGEIQPWHFTDRFLQSVPRAQGVRSIDGWFTTPQIQRIARKAFATMGLPVEGIWERSDLFPREGKLPHAFCIGIDNPDDVRVLCNLDGTVRWMETMLHELGHAVYDAGIDRSLPWVLREPAHTFITEGVAMWFGRRVKDSRWLRSQAGVPQDLADDAAQGLAESQIVFARWALVVCAFERAMYADPDQDLDACWWRLVQDLQGVERPPLWPGGDWAAKIHVSCYPAYYQNYLLGELFASQVDSVIGGADEGRQGQFFRGLFGFGATLPWAETITKVCGRPLSADAFLTDFAEAV